MAKPILKNEKGSEGSEPHKNDNECGLIMPISATENHTEKHWLDVQKLVHRAIISAGFKPRNVWESASSDRISERIIGNIFDLPIVIADISDLNPNVMFELGLRLSSKKPTIVIAEKGCSIPFDIRDFEAIFYPADLNIMGIEEFFENVSTRLKNKFEHYKSKTYSPFLANVIVDVAAPQTREVGTSELILSRLDDLARQVRSLENRSNVETKSTTKASRARNPTTLWFFEVPEANADEFIHSVLGRFGPNSASTIHTKNGRSTIEFEFDSGTPAFIERMILDLAKKYDGGEGLPF